MRSSKLRNLVLSLSLCLLSLCLVGCGASTSPVPSPVSGPIPPPVPDILTAEQATILAEMTVDDLVEALQNLSPPQASDCIIPNNPSAADTDGDGVWDQLDFIYACTQTLPLGQTKTMEGKKRITDPDALSNANLTPGMDSKFLERGLKIVVSSDTPQGPMMDYTDLLTGNFSTRPDGTALTQRFASKRVRTLQNATYVVTSSLQLIFQPAQAAAQSTVSDGSLSITGKKTHTLSGSEPTNSTTLSWGVSTPTALEHSSACSSQPYVGGELRLERIPKPENGIHTVVLSFQSCGEGYQVETLGNSVL